MHYGNRNGVQERVAQVDEQTEHRLVLVGKGGRAGNSTEPLSPQSV